MNIWKRSLSMFLAIMMVFSLLPSHAIAAELEELGETEPTVVETEAQETEAPKVEETEAPEIKETEAPEIKETEAPEIKETEAPEVKETEAPEVKETEAPEVKETEAQETEAQETEAPKAELSGETRKIYFHNVEGWSSVWAAWSFDEEDFDDVAHPGEEMSAAAVLEDVYVVTVPVEADEVLFSDGIEVTAELLEEEKKAGLEITHEIAVSLKSDLAKNLYRDGAWANYADEVAAVEAAAAEAAAKAAEEAAKKAEEEAAKAAEEAAKQTEPPVMDKAPEPTADPVQALIESLPAAVTNQDEYDAVYAVVDEIAENGYALTDAQEFAVVNAMAAADEWFGAEEASQYEEPTSEPTSEPDARAAAPTVPADIAVGGTVIGEGTDAKPDGDIPTGTHWEGPVESTGTICGKDEHKHTDACYTIENFYIPYIHESGCKHAIESKTLGHPETCFVKGAQCTKVICLSEHIRESGKKYHIVFDCKHTHSISEGCYLLGCSNALSGEHTHSKPACYSYTWTLALNKYNITWNWEDVTGSKTETVSVEHGKLLTAPQNATNNYEKDGTTYTFTGWEGLAEGATASGEATFTAKYTTNAVYTITYVSNGNTYTTQTVDVIDGVAQSAVEAPTAPVEAGYVFSGWYTDETYTNAYTFGNKPDGSFTLYAKLEADTNNSGVADSDETVQITLTKTANVEVEVSAANGAKLTDNGNGTYTLLFKENDDTTKKVTVKATPDKGYYIDAVANVEGALADSWKNTDIDSGWLSTDYRNVYTGTLTVESGKSYTVNVTSTKYEWSLPKDAVTVSLNGYLFNGITSVPMAEILKAIYGEDVNADLYDGAVDEGWGSVTIKLETPFQYKVTLKATDKYPAVSDTIMVTASDNRSNADITYNYANGSSFNTEDDFKSYFANNCVKVNGEVVDLEVLLNWNGKIEWTKNDDGTYTAVVTLNESKDWLKSSATFTDLTWAVAEYTVTWVVKDENGNVIQTVGSESVPYGTDVAAEKIPAVPAKTGYTGVWVGTTTGITKDTEIVANYTVNSYTVTWTVNGETYTTTDVVYGTAITAPVYTTPEGHTFHGWQNIPATMPAENITLDATLTANSYDVIWVWQNAEGEQTTPVTLPYGTAITVPAEIPTQYKVGNVTYTRTGWTGLVDGATVPVDGITYTATYTTATAWIVDFDSNGGSEVVDVTVIVPEGETATVAKPTNPTREGYRFDGWLLNGEAYDFATPVTGDITLTAQWVEQVTVSFDVEGDDYKDQTFDINGKATKPADPTKDQAIFGGWLLNGAEYDFATLVTEDITLTAKWIADQNRNGVDDAKETFSIKLNGNGTYVVDGAIDLPLGTVDTVTYLFDSNNPNVTITVTPVVTDGISSSYVASVTGATLTYGEGFVATANLTVNNGAEIEIVCVDVPVLKESSVVDYNFFTKVIPYGDIYDSVISAPAYKDGAVKYTYFARPAMKHTVSIDSLDLDSSIKTLLSTIGVKDFSFDMEELWLPLDAQIEDSVDLQTAVSTYLTKERINGLLDIYNAAHDKAYDEYIAANGDEWYDKIAAEAAGIAAGGAAAVADIQAIYDVVYASAKYYGAHNFGYNATGADTVDELIRIEYSDESMKWATDATVTLKDPRESAFISGSDVTLTYRDYTDEDLLALFGLVDANGNPIEGAVYSIQLSDPYTFEGHNVSETTYELTVKFAGNESYKAAEKTFNITIVKASASIDLPNLNITYGDPYDVHANISTGNKYGNKQELIDSLVEIYIGLDVANLDVNEDGQVTGAGAHVQIFVPKDDAIKAIFDMLNLDIYGEDGETLKFDELQDLLGNLDDLLSQFDSGNETVDGIVNVLESVTGLVDLSALEIQFGGKRPSDVGVYLYGAVSTSGNYETAYDVAYMLIKPQTTEYTLAWNDEALTNAVVTLPMLNVMDKGAHVVESGAKELEAKYLILGVNTDTSDIASAEIYENIRGNVWLNPSEITDNGAYLQIAYGIEWGNEFEYAMPIVRGFAVVPALYDVQLVGATGTPNDELLKEFNNEPQGFSVIVKNDNGEIIFSDHYQNVTALKDNAQLVVNYVGVQTNGQPYNSIEKPVHAGVYAATAIYMEFNDGEKLDISDLKVEDLYELFDLADIGMDAALLVIEPAESTVTVEEKIVNYNSETDILFKDMVKAGSTAEGLKPDTTIISAGIDTNAAFSESGWDAVRGIVNVDFPAWMDALLDQYAPSVKAGMSVAELKDVLLNKLPDISDKLVELGATEEMVNSLANLTGNVASVLAEMPDNIRLSFVDDAKANEIGAYIVTAVVTDSDHYPSIDAGYLIVLPDVDMFELKWNFEDGNGIFTRDLLQHVDLLAKAYDAKSGAPDAAATGKISYMFVGVDSNIEFKHYTDPATLPNGAYIELAYIELDVEGEMVVSDMIARPIVVVASSCKVNIENVETVFDNTDHGVNVTVTNLEGREIDTNNGTLTVMYAGLQTNGKAYMNTEAPVHAGVYEALVTYTENVDGELRYYGANAGYVLIDLAESDIEVTGKTVTYDGNDHTATVVATGSGVTEPDYTLISGGAYVSGDINKIGVDAFHGNVNIDLPTWMDEALADYEFVDGVNAAKVADYIEAYRDELIASVKLDKLVEWNVMTEEEVAATVAKLNAYIDELIAVLKKMPTDVALTFVDDITYSEPGAYFYYGIVTDSDHYPSTDTGLLVIEKMDIVFDLVDTTYAWDGTGKMVDINNPENADGVALIIDRVNNTANILIDEDAQYLLNSLARILDKEFDGDAQLFFISHFGGRRVAEALAQLIDEAEDHVPAELAKVLGAVKTQLEDLPAYGTVTINGALPSEVGDYEVYAVCYSQYFKFAASEATLTILPAHFGGMWVTDVTYNGTEQTGEVVITTGDGQIVDPSEYTVTGNKGTEAGAYEVIVTGTGVHYDHSVTLTWNIMPAEITSVVATDLVYNGNKQTTALTVKAGDLVLTADDYDVTGITGTDAGEYTATVTGKGNFAGTVDAKWNITSAEITSVEVVGAYTYNGKEQTATLVVKAGDLVLNPDDYTVTGNKGTNAGEYTVTVTGKGNFTFTDSANWTIAPAVIDSVVVGELTYNGEEQKPALIVKSGEHVLQDASEGYSVVIEPQTNVGEYNVTVKGTGNYTGSWNGSWTIAPAEITSVVATDVIYNGTEQTATLVVKAGDLILNPDDYTVAGNKGTNAGEYTATVTGKGNFAGDMDAKWTIAPAKITSAEVTSTHTYNGAEQTAILVVKAGDLTLAETDYTVTGNTGLKEGAYKATVTGTGNYTGTADAEWKILPAEITSVEVVGEYTYNGKEQTVELLVKAGEMTVYAGDYKVTGNTATDAGEYTVIVTGIGNFAGVMDAKWTIVPAEVILTVKDNTVLAGTTEIPKVEFEVTNVNNGAVTIEQLAPSATWNVETKNGNLVHGEYANNEVTYSESDNWNVTKIVDGKLTVELGGYVCWNMQTGVYYSDLSFALDDVDDEFAAEYVVETIQMLKDYRDNYVAVAPGTTLDLNGFTVTAAFVNGFAGAHIKDTSNHEGLLIVNPNFCTLAEDNAMFPVYNGTGYLFADVLFGQNTTKTKTETGLQFNFLAAPVMDVVQMLKNGAADNKVEILVRLTWEGSQGIQHQEYVYDDSIVMGVMNTNNGSQTSYGDMFYLVINGANSLKNLRATAYIRSNTGACDHGATLNLTSN